MLKAAKPPSQKSKSQPVTAATKGKTRHLIQRVKVKLPTGVSLKGGNGVSVLWPSNGSQSGAHVTVAHGVADVKTGMIDIHNLHYKTAGRDYFHWDDKGGVFKFRGGKPTEGIYVQTQKVANKFGLALERPANLPVVVKAPVQPKTPAPARPVPTADEDEDSGSESTKAEQEGPETWDTE